MKLKRLVPVIAVFMILLVLSMPFCFAVELNLVYDANGNLVSGDGKYRTYNSLNQLYRVYNGSNSSGTLLYEFKYHPIEERVLVKKSYNRSGGLFETVYYWSQNFITVVNASGSYNFTYVYHNGDLVAQQNPDGTKLFVNTDNKGNAVVVTNSTGAVVERTSYGPFGDIISGGRISRFGYEAQEQQPGYGKVPTDGLVSYYSLENNALDDSGRNNGAVTNASLTTGVVRDSYSFDGSGDYVAINDSSSLDLTSGLTLSAWVKPVEVQQGYVIAKYQAFMVQYMGSGGSNATQGGIWVGGSWTALATSSAIPLNSWTHVVFTYNQSRAYIYINGVLSGSGSSTSSIDTNNQIFCIGAKNATVRDRDFNGSIDEVGLWNRALSAAEVKQLYDYGATRENLLRETDFNARHYGSELGIFTQPDSIISNPYDPQSLNHFMFERGIPTKNKDESGHWIETVLDVGFIAYDLAQLRTSQGQKDWVNWAALGADIIFAVLPAFTGGGALVRGVTKSDKALDAVKLAKERNLLREGMLEAEGLAKNPIGKQVHHMFPVSSVDKFANLGIDINRYGAWVDSTTHLEQSRWITQQWTAFFNNPITRTFEQTVQKANQIENAWRGGMETSQTLYRAARSSLIAYGIYSQNSKNQQSSYGAYDYCSSHSASFC